jgi:TetR/AcrR family transcriptional repressor of nem operon
MSMKSTEQIDTREAIIQAARNTVMKDGYNALSFRDLAADVGIKSASVHYHFPTKGDLAEAVVSRHCSDVEAYLESLSEKPFDETIGAYVKLFRSGIPGMAKSDNAPRICVSAMVSAEVSAIPLPARAQLERFAKANINWLAGVIAKKHKSFTEEKVMARAHAIFAAMEGAQLISHGLGGDRASFDKAVEGYRDAGLLS